MDVKSDVSVPVILLVGLVVLSLSFTFIVLCKHGTVLTRCTYM